MTHKIRKSTVPDAGGWMPCANRAGVYRRWLEEQGSLTARIIAACPADAPFSVRVLHHGDARPCRDERALIGLPPGRCARSRDVLLLSGRTPVVYAHTVVARDHVHHPWHLMDRVGGRALGTVLFTDPRIGRGGLAFHRINGRHPLFQRARAWTACNPSGFWARRASFFLGGYPMLVTEVFLPEILELKQ
jgi:chorismate--pyruvate lyase